MYEKKTENSKLSEQATEKGKIYLLKFSHLEKLNICRRKLKNFEINFK